MNQRSDTPSTPKGPAATASRALDVFEVIADASRPLAIGELMERTGLPKPTLHRMIHALVQHGMVRADPDRRTYGLGAKVFELAHRISAEISLPRLTEGEMLRLAAATRWRAHCGALRGNYVLYLNETGLSGEIQRYYATERFLPVHCTAVGKVILAHFSAGYRNRILQDLPLVRYTGKTITTIDALVRELNDVRERGYAIDNGELADGLRCVAAPLFDQSGAVIAAIGVSAHDDSMSLDAAHNLATDIISSARYISRNIGDTPMRSSKPVPSTPLEQTPVSVALPATAFLGEGPIWCRESQKLIWVDILEPAIHSFDPKSGIDRRTPLPSMATAVGFASSGSLIIASQDTVSLLEKETGNITEFAKLTGESPQNRFNDGRIDANGRFWIGSMSMVGESSSGGLFCLDHSRQFRKVLTGIGTANGLGWSPDGRTMYFTDTMARTIYKFDFDAEEGRLSNQRQFALIEEGRGRPDGLTVDAEGRVWSAHWEGWCVTCYAPDGTIERRIEVPVPRPTSCAFGGADLKTLFITTARVNMSSEQLSAAPLSGSLLSMSVDVPGQPENTFRIQGSVN